MSSYNPNAYSYQYPEYEYNPSPFHQHPGFDSGEYAMGHGASCSSHSSNASPTSPMSPGAGFGGGSSSTSGRGMHSPGFPPEDEYSPLYFGPTPAAGHNDFDFEVGPAMPTTAHKSSRSGNRKSRRDSQASFSSSSGTSSQYPCLEPGCAFTTSRLYDLKRHLNTHRPVELFPCSYSWCGRDVKPFGREDHRTAHMRNVHMLNIAKKEKGGRKPKKASSSQEERR